MANNTTTVLISIIESFTSADMSNATGVVEPEPSAVPPPESWENWLAGTLSLVMPITSIIMYIPCLIIFAADKEMAKKPCYRIMLNLGITDVTQLTCMGIVTGIYSLAQTTGPYQLMKLIGGVGNASWISCTAFAHLLAFNRFVQVCFPMKADAVVFTERNTLVMIVIAWLWGGCFFASYMVPWCGIVFILDQWIWYYDTPPFCTMVGNVEFYQNCTAVGMMAFWYACIIVRLKLLPAQQSTTSNDNSKRELQILVQCFLICCIMGTFFMWWFLIPPAFPDSRWMIFGCQIFWYIDSGINPYIYLIFNSQLRGKYKTLLGMKTTSIQPVSKNTASTRQRE